VALVWTDELYGTGVPQIDAPHQELNHFVCEESSMEGHCAPHACAKNKAAHRGFADAYARVAEKIRRQGASVELTKELEALLSDRLSAHIRRVDTPSLRGA
jgi:hemerythrin